MSDRSLDQVLEQGLPHDIDVEGVVHFARLIGVDGDVGHTLVLIEGEDLHVLELRHLAVLVGNGDVGFLRGVELEQVVEVEVVDRVGVGDDDIFVAGMTEEVHVGVDGLDPVLIVRYGSRGRVIGREDVEAFPFSREVPGFAGTDMVHQGLVVFFGDDTDFGDTGVDHVGQREVDEAVTASEGNGCEGPHGREFLDRGIEGLRMDDAKHIICSHS